MKIHTQKKKCFQCMFMKYTFEINFSILMADNYSPWSVMCTHWRFSKANHFFSFLLGVTEKKRLTWASVWTNNGDSVLSGESLCSSLLNKISFRAWQSREPVNYGNFLVVGLRGKINGEIHCAGQSGTGKQNKKKKKYYMSYSKIT